MSASQISLGKFTIGVILSLILLSSFGLLVMPMQVGCPFMPGETVLCTMNVFEHIDHWQQAFISILMEVLVLGALAIVIESIWNSFLKRVEPLPAPPRNRSSFPPTLFQELFLAGILNPRAP